MRILLHQAIYFLCVFTILPLTIQAQDDLDFELSFEIKKLVPYVSVDRTQLLTAETLSDLNPRYESDWIKDYISVEVSATSQSMLQKVVSKNDTLTQEQKELMNRADLGSQIQILVKYIPDNTLKHNDVKILDFHFTLNPDIDAKYPGGVSQLESFIKTNCIKKIPKSSLKRYKMSAVEFSINEVGQVTDIAVSGISSNKETNDLLYEAVCNMTDWVPAQYTEGMTLKQDYVLLVGDRESCARNYYSVK